MRASEEFNEKINNATKQIARCCGDTFRYFFCLLLSSDRRDGGGPGLAIQTEAAMDDDGGRGLGKNAIQNPRGRGKKGSQGERDNLCSEQRFLRNAKADSANQSTHPLTQLVRITQSAWTLCVL
jgi:hypothetical protein